MSEQPHLPDETEPTSSTMVLQRMIGGYIITQLLAVAAKLRIADLLRDGPQRSDDLAQATQTHPRALYRMLRALTSVGIFAETAAGCFALTPLAECLQTGAPHSLRSWAMLCGEEWWWHAWGKLSAGVQTGQTPFVQSHHMELFAYLTHHPDAAQLFDEAMTDMTGADFRATLAAYDFTGAATAIDIGGGQGLLLAALLQMYPQMRGMLFDRAPVLDGARQLLQREGVAARCVCVAGDFFDMVPTGGDVYMLRNIIHDWEDARALQILQNCRRAMHAQARLLLLEHVIPLDNTPTGKLSDIMMMVIPGGLKRTASEFAALLSAAGFQLTRIIPTEAQRSLIEGVPV